mmetsp:Transcript_4698/g.6178  ORF Transcript_4698/g.6178 Transcript_4698/m.6178 type:complete len:622 (-) Transcript_4698:459-2324(-)
MSGTNPEDTLRRAEEAVARAFASPNALGRSMKSNSKPPAKGLATAAAKPLPPSSARASRASLERFQPKSFTTPTAPRANPVPGTAEFVKNETPMSPMRNYADTASQASQASSRELDLKSNDNAFHVVANLVLDRLNKKVQPGATEYTVDPEDRVFFDEMVPDSVRCSFVEALRFRAAQPRGKQNNLLLKLTDQCVMLGLDREEQNNILLNSKLAKAALNRGDATANGAQGSATAQASSRSASVKELSLSPKYTPRLSLNASLRSRSPPPKPERGNVVVEKVQHQEELSQHADQIRMQANEIKRLNESIKTKEQKERGWQETQEKELMSRQQALMDEKLLKAQQDRLSQEQLQHIDTEKNAITNELSTVMNLPHTSLLDEPSQTTTVGKQGLTSSGVSGPNDGDLSEVMATKKESFARSQVMAEIKEATDLLNDSKTAETADFWRAHIEELQNRLKAMNGAAEGQGADQNGEDTSAIQYQEKVSAHYDGALNRLSREEYLERNRRMRESIPSATFVGTRGLEGLDSGGDASQADPSGAQSVYSGASQSEAVNPSGAQSVYSGASQTYYSGGPSSYYSGNRSYATESPVVDVVAPADLPQGYVFEAQIGDKKFLATVVRNVFL